MLAVAPAIGTWVCVTFHAGPLCAGLPYAEIYQRATNEFAEAQFFKPAETKPDDLIFTLAPLVLQQVRAASGPLSLSDQFAALSVSNGSHWLDPSRPTIYWQADAVQIGGKTHARFGYIWCYLNGPDQSGPWRPANSTAANSAAFALPLQGIRITLSPSGLPAIWEVLADSSGARLFFVSQNLEAAALSQFGKPLPGRRYAIERSVEACPDVIVARIIDDSPVAMGPIMYLSADTRSVSTLICRCMPAQARKLVRTRTYELMPFQIASTNSLFMRAEAVLTGGTRFRSGDDAGENRLESALRLPAAFSGP